MSQSRGRDPGSNSSAAVGTPQPSGSRPRVWIVDDSPLEIEMAKRALGERYEIQTFGEGATMLERLAAGPAPDTVVLDWQLPGPSGIEVCGFLRATMDEAALPVLMLTVHGNKQDVVEGLAAGANDYVTKPYDAAELLARVSTLVRTRQLHERARCAELACELDRQRLRDSERRLRAVTEAIPQLVWTAEPAGYFDYVNPRWLELTGITLDEARASGWSSVAHPDDRDAALAAWQDALATGETYETQVRLRHATGGRYRWYLGRAVPLRDASGQLTKWFGTFTDIDAQKRAERSLDLLARAGAVLAGSLGSLERCKSITEMLVPALADACGVYLEGSTDAFELVAGATSDPSGVAQLEALGHAAPLLRAESRAPRSAFVPDVAAALRSAPPDDAACLAALNEAGITSLLLAPIAMQERQVGLLALAFAGSERRYDEADRALANELAHRASVAIDNARLFEMTQLERARVEEANHAKDEFLAIVSHELRSPLTSILGWANLLSEGGLSADDHGRAVETIARNARSQTQLISDLLNISSIMSGKLRLNVSPLQPGPVVEAGLETIRPAAEAKGVRLQPIIDLHAGIVHGDPERFQQIVWNLLTNAVKFTPKGGRIQVRVQRADSDIEIVVSDTGCGIPTEFLPHVFDRFRQADGSVSRRHGGLGLGLSITKHLVELHGGTIKALSPGPNLGATFVVRLPLAPLSATPLGQPETRTPSARPAPVKCPPEIVGLRVMLVDDEPDVSAFMSSVLQSCKVEVTTVSSAADAIDTIRASPPDVLVSDIGMPGESGYDLIRMLRRLPPEQGGRTPAVALTGYTRLEDRTRALMMGFDMHIAKPIEPAELLAVLARLASRIKKA